MSRSAEAIQRDLIAKLPPGWVWPRDEDSLVAALLWPMAAGLAELEATAEAMMAEVDPRTAVLCLPDFERVLGPDPCGRDPATLPLAERQKLAHMRWIARGGQSIPYFVALAAARGVAITIKEYRTSQAGVLQAGDELVNSPEQFAWWVELLLGDWRVFRAGESTAGDLLYEFTLSDIECDLRRAAPAHTEVFFTYLEAA